MTETTQSRRLTAIMFTDVVGYSKLMGSDERRALVVLQRHRQIVSGMVSAHNGTVHKELGDGTLSSFASAVDALHCARAIQDVLSRPGAGEYFQLRIGLHVGDVVVEGGDLLGDGVNVASRIESLAPPGGVAISGPFHSTVSGQPGLKVRNLGDRELKNIEKPVIVYVLDPQGAPTTTVTSQSPNGSRSGAPVARRRGVPVQAWLAGGLALLVLAVLFVLDIVGIRERTIGPGRIESLAVLPLENVSRDPDQAYFADGVTEELSTRLAKVSALRVIAHGSVVAAASAGRSTKDIGRALNVAAVLAGSVRQDAERVRITMQLVQVATGKLLWAESYDRTLRDVLTLQSEVARAVVKEIQVQLTPQERTRMESAGPVDPEAYQLLLKGRYAWSKYTEGGFREAERYFRAAIEIAPTYAPAWAGLADASYGLSSIVLPPNVAIPRAREAAEKALSLDESLAEAHTSRGIVRMVYDWDWPGAEKDFDRAIELRPGDANARLWRGQLLVCLGRFDEGLAETRRALDLDPLSSWISASVGWHLYFARRNDQAIEHLRGGLATSPEFYIFHVFLGLALNQQGDHVNAIAAMEKGVALDRNNDNLGQLAQVYGTAGRRADAERLIAELTERARIGFVPSGSFVNAHAGLGDKDQTFQWLDRALEDHSESLIFLKVDPGLDGLRSDPRFDRALRRLRLSP